MPGRTAFINMLNDSNGGIRKQRGKVFAFWMTYLVAFILFTLLLTPVFSTIMDYRPLLSPHPVDEVADEPDELGDIEPIILEEDFDYFIPSSSPFYNAFKNQKRVNCLLLGVHSGLTDTIMLVSYSVDTQMIDVISVPRDTYYHRKGYIGEAEDKINAAYRKNPLNSAIAVSNVLLGMPINYYIVIEDKGLKDIVDFIGGVPMNIEFHMRYEDPLDKPPLKIDIPAGQQTLDGAHAVQFLRYRHGYKEGDLGRVKAQQEFMKSALKQALKTDLSKLITKIQENVVSDLPLNIMLYLAQKTIGMSGENIRTQTMPGRAIPDPPYYVYPDTKKIEAMIREVYSMEARAVTNGGIST